jgi:hypothetical protein
VPAVKKIPVGAVEITARELLLPARTPTGGAKSEVAVSVAPPAEKPAAEARDEGEVAAPTAWGPRGVGKDEARAEDEAAAPTASRTTAKESDSEAREEEEAARAAGEAKDRANMVEMKA